MRDVFCLFVFFFFDNFKLLLLTIASFEQAVRSNSLSSEDIEQDADRLITAAETIHNDLNDVASILNPTLSLTASTEHGPDTDFSLSVVEYLVLYSSKHPTVVLTRN